MRENIYVKVEIPAALLEDKTELARFLAEKVQYTYEKGKAEAEKQDKIDAFLAKAHEDWDMTVGEYWRAVIVQLLPLIGIPIDEDMGFRKLSELLESMSGEVQDELNEIITRLQRKNAKSIFLS